jgi:hypothetical protein
VGGHRDSSQHNSVYNGQKRIYKKELKNTIPETVSTLRKLLVKLKDISESKTKAISDLETAVTKMRAQYEDSREKCNKGREAPSITPSQEPVGSSRGARSAICYHYSRTSKKQSPGAAPPGDKREAQLSSPREQNTTATL